MHVSLQPSTCTVSCPHFFHSSCDSSSCHFSNHSVTHPFIQLFFHPGSLSCLLLRSPTDWAHQCLPVEIASFVTCVYLLVPSTGIGYASIVIVSLLNVYYIVILAWATYYLFHSFQKELPWAHCNHSWNTPQCMEDTLRRNESHWVSLSTVNFTSPVIEFWE